MIYCSNLNIIFFKTKKVGGTSFEIALSKYCDENDIVTPISPEDENTRASLGFQRPVNYEMQNRSNNLVNLGVSGNFQNHITAEEIRQNLGNDIFRKCTKIAIHREPLDFLISQYWFRQRNKKKKNMTAASFRLWLEKNHKNCLENYEIAPLSGRNAPDVVINYESMSAGIENIKELPFDFLSTFSSLNAKGNFRPPNTKDPIRFFQDNNCADYIPIIDGLIDSARAFS